MDPDVLEFVNKFVKVEGNGAPPPDLDEFMKDENVAQFNRRYGVAQTVEGKSGKAPVKRQAPDPGASRLTLQISDIVDYPPEYTSTAVQAVKDDVTAKNNAVKAFTDPIDGDKAAKRLKALADLEKAIADGVKVVRAHDAEMRKYFKSLKALAPKINTADKLDAVTGGTDNPWKAEREAYDAQKAKVIAAQNDHKYADANRELTALEGAMKALVDKKLEQVNQKVDEVTGANGGATKAKELVDQLSANPGLIAEMPVEKQLALLKQLRDKVVTCRTCKKGMTSDEYFANNRKCPTCNTGNLTLPGKCDSCGKPGKPSATSPCAPPCGGTSWTIDERVRYEIKMPDGSEVPSQNQDLLKARAVLFANVKMDEKFVAKDKEKRKQVVEKIRDDPKYKDAEQNWAKWAKDGDIAKMQEFFDFVVKEQCKIMGHDKPNPDPGNFPNGPVGVRFMQPGDPGCSLDPGDFAETEPGFPANININKMHGSFGDFKEMTDTIIHENAHVYQGMIGAQMRKQPPFDDGKARDALLNDPDMKVQAQLFEENDRTYIPPPSS
jgi:hypothetical protein